MGCVVALRQELDSFYPESQCGQGQVLSQQSVKLEVHRWVSLWQEETPGIWTSLAMSGKRMTWRETLSGAENRLYSGGNRKTIRNVSGGFIRSQCTWSAEMRRKD